MKKTISAFIGLGLIASPLMAVAQDVSVDANVSADVNTDTNVESANAQGQVKAQANVSVQANVEAKVTKAKEAADKELDRRIDKLSGLSARITDATHISAEAKTSITSQINAQISELQTLQSAIAAEASTTVLRVQIESIGKTYSAYSLVSRQLALMAATDRVADVAGAMSTVAGKLETRISAAGTTTSAATEALENMKDKVASAQQKASEAVQGIANLSPSNGDKTIQQTNLKALADSRASIRSAQQDLIAARKSMTTIMKELKVAAEASASATTTATTP